ncbi:MAG: hypothetical protein AAB486_03245 [Patescibacteria group bacterium]
MTSDILGQLANLIINFISGTGYFGIFTLMTVESALIPIPSEITMPFAGFLVSRGQMDLLTVSLVGAFGNLIGSLLAYGLGYWGQEKVVRVLIRKYGRSFPCRPELPKLVCLNSFSTRPWARLSGPIY